MTLAVIDTNVVVAALLSKHEDAATVQVMIKSFTGELTPVYSELILTEYQDVLHRPKFDFPPEDQEYIISAIRKFGQAVNPRHSDVALPDNKDLPFYEAAKSFHNCYLVTGNKKHFPSEPFIVTPREMLDMFIHHSLNND